MISGIVVKHRSRPQARRALSTAEAEYHAVITGAAVDVVSSSIRHRPSRSAQGRKGSDREDVLESRSSIPCNLQRIHERQGQTRGVLQANSGMPYFA